MLAYVSDSCAAGAARFRPTRNMKQDMHGESISVNGLNSTLDQNGLNRSVLSTNVVNFPTAMIYVLALGIPGNVLVSAVYAINMTTSTRVYMFALAVADSAVCICGIILATIPHNIISREVIGYLTFMSVAFSVFIMTFVSIERLLAVRRPHTFSLSTSRAKRALWVMVIAAAICAGTLTTQRVYDNVAAMRITVAVIIASNAGVIIICYTLVAVTILMLAKDAQRKVGGASSSALSKPSTSHALSNQLTMVNTEADVTSHTRKSGTTKTTTKVAAAYRNMSVLLIITIVFLLSWMPISLHSIGFPLSKNWNRLYLINSFINPFIYNVVSRMFRNDVRLFYRKIISRLRDRP